MLFFAFCKAYFRFHTPMERPVPRDRNFAIKIPFFRYHRPMRRRQNLLSNFSLTVGTFLLLFGGTEYALRITGIDKGRPTPPQIYQKSDEPALSYELKPNLSEEAFRATVVTDRRGFRSEDIHPGKPTIALLGDSITFGYGVENDQTLASRLNTLLEKKFNVVAGAAPGYTLGQEAALYKEKIGQLHPDTLVLVFYWNDLNDTEPAVLDDEGNLQPPGWTPAQPKCHPIETGFLGYLPGRCWLDLHSAFYRTIKKVIIARTEQGNLKAQETEYRQNAFGDEVTDEHLKKYDHTLTEFVKTLPRTMRMLFVIWPEKHLHLESGQKLRVIAEKNDFQVLNLYEVFGNKPESLGWDTVHPSAKTVEEAGGVIKAALEEWKLLPDLTP